MGLPSLGIGGVANTHDDLTNPPQQPLADGSTDYVPPGPDETQWSNPDINDPNRGYFAVDPGDGSPTVVSPSFNNDVNRYRQLGAQGQGSVNLDQSYTGASRGLQLGALGMLRAQAEGSAPSSAAILSQRANQNAVQNAGAQVTAAKSTGGALAASRGAGTAAGAAMLAGNAQNANARAAEISRGQNAYAAGTGALMGQDIGEATTNANLEAAQNALNEHRQQAYEKMAWDARNAEMNAANQAHNQDTIRLQGERAQRDAEAQADVNKIKDTASLGSGILSDPRAKTHTMAMGSLSSLMRGRR